MRRVFEAEHRRDARLRELEQQLASEPGDAERARLLAEYEALQHAQETSGAYDVDRRIETVLSSLGLPESAWHQTIAGFSGGERNVIGLARVLLSEPDVMLLDEPSNHLDMEGVEWFVDFVRRSPAAVVMVSHNRHVLDATIDHIWEVDRGQRDPVDRRLERLPAAEGRGEGAAGAAVEGAGAPRAAHRVPGAAARRHGEGLRRPRSGAAREVDAEAPRDDGQGREARRRAQALRGVVRRRGAQRPHRAGGQGLLVRVRRPADLRAREPRARVRRARLPRGPQRQRKDDALPRAPDEGLLGEPDAPARQVGPGRRVPPDARRARRRRDDPRLVLRGDEAAPHARGRPAPPLPLHARGSRSQGRDALGRREEPPPARAARRRRR